MTDPLLQLLDGLPSGRLDAARGDRIRVRCHSALARARRTAARDADRRRSRPAKDEAGVARIWAPVVGCLGGLYLAQVLREMLGMYGLL